jgi:putative inorganic carbon (HCO3(-)) transporter
MGWRTGARKGSGPLTLRTIEKERHLSPQRTRVAQADDDLPALLARDRVYAMAQVTLFVKLMLTVVVLDYQAEDTFALPKSVAAHATSLVLGALLVWLFARYGRRLLSWSPVHVAVGAMLVVFSLATLFALDPEIALFGTPRRFLGLTHLLDNAVLYVGAATLFRDARSLRLLAIVALGTAVPEIIYTGVQRAGLDPLKFRESATPVIGTLGNPDLLGAYLAMVGISALSFSFLLSSRLPRWITAALVALGVSCVGILLVVGVRSGLLAIGSGFAATILLAVLLPWRRAWWMRGLLAFPVVFVLAVLVSPVAARLNPASLLNDQAITVRFEIWDTAERAVAARPLLGIGPDNFAVFYPANRSEASAKTGLLENSTHSFWLYAATSAGLLGFAALLGLVALVIAGGIRAARAGQVGALALVPFFAYLGQSFANVNEIVVDWVFWLSAGVVVAASAQPLPRPRTGFRRPRRATLTGVVALGAAAALAVTFVLPRITTDEALARSEGLNNVNRGREAIPFAQAAIQGDPRRGEMWSSYGTALATSGSLVAAIEAYTAASQREPWQALGWRNIAIVWNQLGNRAAARAAAERALRVDRYDGESHDLMASLSYDAGDYARAAAEGERAIALRNPPQESTYFTTSSAYVQLKDLPRAETVIRDGIKLYPSALLRVQLAAVLGDEGRTAEAIAVLDALLAESPSLVDAARLRQALVGK